MTNIIGAFYHNKTVPKTERSVLDVVSDVTGEISPPPLPQLILHRIYVCLNYDKFRSSFIAAGLHNYVVGIKLLNYFCVQD
jgi:hypothetical protein